MTRRVALVVAVLGLVAGAAGQARADVELGIDFTQPGDTVNASGYSLGYEFTANTSISVVALGTFDYDQNGFSQAQQVGLWSSSGTLLASAFVDNSDPLEGFWRFHEIGPVTLAAGESYIVASQGGEGYAYNSSGVTISPAITWVRDRWEATSTANTPLVFPIRSENRPLSSPGFFGGNLKIEAAPVPEPATFATAGLGVLMGLGYAWSRRKRAAA